MANTYTQIHLHIVLAPRFREGLIHAAWSEELHKYITALVQSGNHKMLAVNSMPDHLHMFICMRPAESLSDMMERVKTNSSKWINETGKTPRKFNWQDGYGAFSYARSALPDVCSYIHSQQQHHKKETFLDEYREDARPFRGGMG